MTLQAALPGLVAGALGLVAGLAALVFGAPVLGAVAGILALAAATGTLRLAQRLEEQSALQALVEAEVRTLRADAARRPGKAGTTDGTHPSRSDSDFTLTPDQDDEAERSGGEQTGEELVDQTTGLFSEGFFRIALDSRIAAARRHLRPVAMVLIEVVEGLPANEPSAVEAGVVAETIRETLREADTACRLKNGYFALLLEDTPENGAIWTVERIRRQLVEARDGLTVWAGIACYPAHAFDPEEILTAADQALVSAKEWRQDRIEVAAAGD